VTALATPEDLDRAVVLDLGSQNRLDQPEFILNFYTMFVIIYKLVLKVGK
jgi:hypothetical protein